MTQKIPGQRCWGEDRDSAYDAALRIIRANGIGSLSKDSLVNLALAYIALSVIPPKEGR